MMDGHSTVVGVKLVQALQKETHLLVETEVRRSIYRYTVTGALVHWWWWY